MNYKKLIILCLVLIIILVLVNLFKYNTENFKNSSTIKLSPKLSKKNIEHLKKGQQKMSKMLKVFDNICQKNNIRYFVIAGTLIGAKLYQGWIPWDGDIDIEVNEKDYKKLKKILETKLPKNMWYQNKDTDKYYKDRILGKIRDLNSCYIDFPYVGKQSHQGLQIDINIYKEKNGKIYFPDDKSVNYLTINDIYPLKRVPFEDFNVNIMNNYEKYLDNKYGLKWRKILPIEKRYPHEGKINSNKTCKFHYEKYPNLYK